MEKIELSKRFYRRQTVEKYQKKLMLLGDSDVSKVYHFLTIRILILLIIFFGVLFFTRGSLVSAIICAVIIYFGFTFLIFESRIEKRKRKLEREAMYFFEVLSLALESGKNLIQALSVTTKHVEGELSDMFQGTLREIEYGKGFSDAIGSLKKKVPSDAIQNVLLNIIQANESGSNIIEALKRQIDYLSNKRIMDLKKSMNQIPIKISIVSVLILIPLILLIILAPVLLDYIIG